MVWSNFTKGRRGNLQAFFLRIQQSTSVRFCDTTLPTARFVQRSLLSFHRQRYEISSRTSPSQYYFFGCSTSLTHSASPSFLLLHLSFSRDLRSQAEWAFTRPKSNDFFLDSRNNYTMGNKVSAAYKRHSDAKSGHKKKPVSPVPSHPSSLTSQESNSNASDIIRHGRKFHNFSESTYWLPNDEEEMDRLVGVSCVPQSSQ